MKKPLAARVLEAYDNVRLLHGSRGAATYVELMELLRELAEGAWLEIPAGFCPTCGFRPSLGRSTNLCGVCVSNRDSGAQR